jgi:hypothetical protein
MYIPLNADTNLRQNNLRNPEGPKAVDFPEAVKNKPGAQQHN